ncbi:amino acid permease [Paenibacillus sp. OV219]|uniref:amino acid permease n=1 Tax=Paenibacillus sp. OV219 TaxID=1884377 RepID=UPI0008BC4CFF|nr:amino acid permease [Paenibacillus sp. OV219]SEO82908.1 amino acid/polyamine/organocation transporter, APC superfamily [Paenibacillus sp. OV219]
MHEKGLSWQQLSLIGVGSIIGAGFFLGTGLSIRTAGPSVLIGYIIAGVTTFIVFASLAQMTANDPQSGSFRAYARIAFGRSAGFLSGWVYWLSGVLIMSSEIVALSTFTEYWFKGVPLGVFSIAYAALGFGINFLGVRNFSQVESTFAIVKLAILVGFVLFGALFIFGAIHPAATVATASPGVQPWFPHGVKGLWSAMVIIFFSFGGIEVVGVTASELRRKEDIIKSGIALLISLVLIYVLALYLVLRMADWRGLSEATSPFVTALSTFSIPYLDTLFNLVIISAAFSTMVGALFSISRIIVSLAEDGDAPRGLAKLNRRGVAWKSLLLTAAALAVSIGCSYALPNTMYEYVTTAAGVMLILNWVLILASYLKLQAKQHPAQKPHRTIAHPYAAYAGIGFILIAISGALLHRNERIGLGLSAALIIIVLLASRLVAARHKH